MSSIEACVERARLARSRGTFAPESGGRGWGLIERGHRDDRPHAPGGYASATEAARSRRGDPRVKEPFVSERAPGPPRASARFQPREPGTQPPQSHGNARGPRNRERRGRPGEIGLKEPPAERPSARAAAPDPYKPSAAVLIDPISRRDAGDIGGLRRPSLFLRPRTPAGGSAEFRRPGLAPRATR